MTGNLRKFRKNLDSLKLLSESPKQKLFALPAVEFCPLNIPVFKSKE